MAAQGTIMYQDPSITTVGAVRGWKVGFGLTEKGTVCLVYKIGSNGSVNTISTEIPLLANGKADSNAVQSWLSSQGVSLPQAAKSLIGG